METIIVPTITLFSWIFCYILKLWILDEQKRVIPTVAAIVGLILGLVTLGFNLDAALTGVVSGLAATGTNELVKQYKKDTESL